MKKILTVAALSILSIILLNQTTKLQEQDIENQFKLWSVKFNKSYGNVERIYRQMVYESNLKKIQTHNADKTQTYQVGENQFTDLTPEEFEQIYLSNHSEKILTENLETYTPTNEALSAVDWSSLTQVKDQGFCQCSNAFASIGAIESYARINVNPSLSNFSEQYLVDCDTISNGCTGNVIAYNFKYSIQNGVVFDSSYPWKGVKQACQKRTGYKYFTSAKLVTSTVAAVQSAITLSPVAVGLNANSNFINYVNGVFSNCVSSPFTNTYFLAVGYNQDGTWIIKNSWGTLWGQNGFMTLAAGNTCGILYEVYKLS